MPSFNRVDPYVALADVYQSAGFADYSKAMAPQILNLIFDMEWTGSSLLELGCGTGDLAAWLAERSLRVTALDISASMLRRAAETAKATGAVGTEFVQGDIRAYKAQTRYDLVLCIGSALNYAPALRDLEAIFKTAYTALESAKLFIFDLRTIQGCAKAGSGDHIVSDKPDEHMIVSRNTFNYETLVLTSQYTILRYDHAGWQRFEETHLLRGYPVQGVLRALQSAKFKLLRTLTPDFEPAEEHKNAEQLIFVAQRED